MRTCGVLLPVSSLPSPYGIGTAGAAAKEFVRFLAESGQHLWQILPLGPTGYGDSPYQSVSAFAGNPYFIDLDTLCEEGLLRRDELEHEEFGRPPGSVDYAALYENRFAVLKKAAERIPEEEPEFRAFVKSQRDWLPEYALFMAIKEENGMRAFAEWPEPLRAREAEALAAAQERLAEEILFWEKLQYLFRRQWDGLHAFAKQNGIRIVGDLPIYVSPDSAELWARPELFETDGAGRMTRVAGVPPDAFSPTGQLWGNPLYEWEYHKKTGFSWWKRRMQAAAEFYDGVRIDHFRGFAGYYSVPAQEKTAEHGVWEKGPGLDFIRAIKEALPREFLVIAEDLGFLTEDVRDLLEESGFPGMKVIQFAFDSREPSDYLPHRFPPNCVAYPGTHDNDTLLGWERALSPEALAYARDYLGVPEGESLREAVLRACLASAADTAVIPMQDWLALGSEARINTPSTLGGNWRWRLLPGMLTPELSKKMLQMAKLCGRA
jgi:4-alpha-glucanotransferase